MMQLHPFIYVINLG